jgi:hypothetical protein
MPKCARKECRKQFTRKRPWQKYCSTTCGSLARGAKRNKKVRVALELLDDHRAEQAGVGGGQ